MGLAVFLVATSALAVYGVLSTPTPRAVAGIGSADAFTCSQAQDDWGSPGASQLPRPSGGTVPEGFTPVKAVVCDSARSGRVAAGFRPLNAPAELLTAIG